MDRIRLVCLTQDSEIRRAERLMCTAAQLTQNGHKWTINDFLTNYEKPARLSMVENLCKLPHPTLQKFGVITFVVFGASRRFLAQITRHQVDVKFMSASLQYSDYTDNSDFCVPYEFIDKPTKTEEYLHSCVDAMGAYEELRGQDGEQHDAAGYAAPQGLRNTLIMSATIFEWKHIISQRICRRNSLETRYVLLRIWEYLYDKFPELFGPDSTGPFCQQSYCQEGKMSCGTPIVFTATPKEIIAEDFPLLADAPKCVYELGA